MPPHEAFQQRRPLRAGATGPPFRHEQSGRPRLALVTAAQDAERERRKRAHLKRIAAIVPVSDYRDVVG